VATILVLQQAAPQQGGMGMALLIQLVLIVAIMYFLFILPQRREAKRHREMLAALRPGDEIVTMGGLVGEIIQLRDEVVTIKSGEARLVVERARIARLMREPAPATR
jgi:preprotein translocase subunit YajC